jgi:exosortase
MSMAAAPPPSAPAATAAAERPLLAPEARVRLGILAVLFAAVHYDILYRIAIFAWTDGDWSHAFLVPLFSLYFIHQQRDRLANLAPRTFWPGLALAGLGLGGYLAALAAGNDMLKGYAMIVELVGITLLMVGPAMMRYLWFPILYLAFAVKVSEPIWDVVAGTLQIIAAQSAVVLLLVVGVEAHVTETTIELFDGARQLGSLNVAEACSGMRMLMTFLALGTAMAYLWNRPWWAKILMVALCVPIALLVNVGRVAVLGLLYLVDPKYSQGDFHIFMGMLMLIPALGLFVLIGWVLNVLIDPVKAELEA